MCYNWEPLSQHFSWCMMWVYGYMVTRHVNNEPYIKHINQIGYSDLRTGMSRLSLTTHFDTPVVHWNFGIAAIASIGVRSWLVGTLIFPDFLGCWSLGRYHISSRRKYKYPNWLPKLVPYIATFSILIMNKWCLNLQLTSWYVMLEQNHNPWVLNRSRVEWNLSHRSHQSPLRSVHPLVYRHLALGQN